MSWGIRLEKSLVSDRETWKSHETFTHGPIKQLALLVENPCLSRTGLLSNLGVLILQ